MRRPHHRMAVGDAAGRGICWVRLVVSVATFWEIMSCASSDASFIGKGRMGPSIFAGLSNERSIRISSGGAACNHLALAWCKTHGDAAGDRVARMELNARALARLAQCGPTHCVALIPDFTPNRIKRFGVPPELRYFKLASMRAAYAQHVTHTTSSTRRNATALKDRLQGASTWRNRRNRACPTPDNAHGRRRGGREFRR